jgi:hypothetical protein
VIAQRGSLPVETDACVTYVASTFFEVITFIHVNSLRKAKAWVVCISGGFLSLHPFNGVLDYRRVLTGSVPGFGQMLLRTCLVEVHK